MRNLSLQTFLRMKLKSEAVEPKMVLLTTMFLDQGPRPAVYREDFSTVWMGEPEN